MPKAHIQLGSAIVGTISFETEHLYSTGGPEFPQLHLTVNLGLTAHTRVGANDAVSVLPTTWVTVAGELRLGTDSILSRFRDDVALYADKRERESSSQLLLEIPISLTDIFHVETKRTDNFQAALKFRPLLAFHGRSGGIEHFELAHVEAMVFTVAKSKWLGLLEQMGYGRFEILEVRVGDTLRSELVKAVEQVRKAKDYLIAGEWNTAVTHCRIALEEMVGSQGLAVADHAKFRTKVEAFVTGYLSSKLQTAQSKLVSEEFLGIWAAASKSPHPSASDYFRRRDAVFLHHKVCALLEYVSRILTE